MRCASIFFLIVTLIACSHIRLTAHPEYATVHVPRYDRSRPEDPHVTIARIRRKTFGSVLKPMDNGHPEFLYLRPGVYEVELILCGPLEGQGGVFIHGSNSADLQVSDTGFYTLACEVDDNGRASVHLVSDSSLHSDLRKLRAQAG